MNKITNTPLFSSNHKSTAAELAPLGNYLSFERDFTVETIFGNRWNIVACRDEENILAGRFRSQFFHIHQKIMWLIHISRIEQLPLKYIDKFITENEVAVPNGTTSKVIRYFNGKLKPSGDGRLALGDIDENRFLTPKIVWGLARACWQNLICDESLLSPIEISKRSTANKSHSDIAYTLVKEAITTLSQRSTFEELKPFQVETIAKRVVLGLKETISNSNLGHQYTSIEIRNPKITDANEDVLEFTHCIDNIIATAQALESFCAEEETSLRYNLRNKILKKKVLCQSFQTNTAK